MREAAVLCRKTPGSVEFWDNEAAVQWLEIQSESEKLKAEGKNMDCHVYIAEEVLSNPAVGKQLVS